MSVCVIKNLPKLLLLKLELKITCIGQVDVSNCCKEEEIPQNQRFPGRQHIDVVL